jgi:hypothetical protein
MPGICHFAIASGAQQNVATYYLEAVRPYAMVSFCN